MKPVEKFYVPVTTETTPPVTTETTPPITTETTPPVTTETTPPVTTETTPPVTTETTPPFTIETSPPFTTETTPPYIPTETIITTPTPTNTINNSSVDVITTPPPSLHTPSVNKMNSMGLYSFGNKKPSSGITQIGGEGPNNYFQPNIIIRKKQENDGTNSKYRVEFGVGDELKPFLPMAQNLMGPQNEQNQSMDFSYGGDSGYNLNGYDNDPLNTALKNAKSIFLKDNSKIGVGSTTCKDCGETYQETFDNNDGDTDLSRNSNLSTSLDSNYRIIDKTPNKTTNYNMGNNNSTFTHNCKMKEFLPGYQIQAPKCWDVPQQRPPVCIQNKQRLPSAVFDRGTPLNALNLDTQVGSIMPKFKYSEERR